MARHYWLENININLKTPLLTWKEQYLLGKTIINLNTSILTWKYEYFLGNPTINLDASIFTWKDHSSLGNIPWKLKYGQTLVILCFPYSLGHQLCHRHAIHHFICWRYYVSDWFTSFYVADRFNMLVVYILLTWAVTDISKLSTTDFVPKIRHEHQCTISPN